MAERDLALIARGLWQIVNRRTEPHEEPHPPGEPSRGQLFRERAALNLNEDLESAQEAMDNNGRVAQEARERLELLERHKAKEYDALVAMLTRLTVQMTALLNGEQESMIYKLGVADHLSDVLFHPQQDDEFALVKAIRDFRVAFRG